MAKEKTKQATGKVQIRKFGLSKAQSSAENLDKAALILKHTHESARALLTAFDMVRKQTPGGTTDEEQDLLRAMLVFAAAGLDSMVKQLMRDVLPLLVKWDPKAKEGLEKFVVRQLRGDVANETLTGTSRNFLARILTAESQQGQAVEEYIYSLTGTSLQSAMQLMHAANALGITPASAGIDEKSLRHIFDIRNKIIHELDINFEPLRRNRETRRRAQMLTSTNSLLDVAERIFRAVYSKVDR